MELLPDELRDRPPQRGLMLRCRDWVIAAGLKLNVVPIDSTWTRRSLASGSRNRLPTPAEPERVAPASASRSGPVPRVGAPETALVTAPFPIGHPAAARSTRRLGCPPIGC